MGRKLTWGTAVFTLWAAIGSAAAEVYVTSPSTGRILVLDSSGAVTRVIGASGGLQEPYGIAIDSQRSLLVTDYAAGRVLRYSPDGSNASIVASNIPRPDGLSVGPGGDLFLVSREKRQATSRLKSVPSDDPTSTYLRQVWMVPAGGSLPVQIATIGESNRLAQTGLLRSGPHAGDLLVLSSRPGFIARLRQAGPSSFERTPDFIASVPGEPTSLAFSRTGDLLVGTSDGSVLRYSDTGIRQLDFATGLPLGPTRLSVNMDGIVHITPVGGTSIIRYDSHANRLADLTGATAPLAEAINSGCVPTPVGQNVAVSPAAGVNVIFDNVVQSGETCLQTTALAAGVVITPQGNTIPSYARKLWEDRGFVVYDLTTTATITDSVAEEFFSQNPEARVMHAHGSGQAFQDATVLILPDDPRSRSPFLSEFIVYLDTRPLRDVILLKLDNLQAALDGIDSIGEEQLATLQALLAEITGLIGEGFPDGPRAEAISRLRDLKQFVRQNSGEGIPNRSGPDGGSNPAGNLLSLADTLIFQLSL